MHQLIPPASCNVYTPKVLADALIAALGDSLTARWLEPCIGKGALLEAISRGGTQKQRIVGLDLAETPEPNDRLGCVSRSTEFLDWAARTTQRFDRIVANPPYISISRLPESVKAAALQIATLRGGTIPRGANCWFAFLCASLSLLKPDGCLAFVLPAAYEYADYARDLRTDLPNHFASVDVHRCQTPIFEKVDDGAIVLVCRGFAQKSQRWQRHEHATLPDLVASITNSDSEGIDMSISAAPLSKPNGLVRFDSIASVGLGAVTGDASFFLMSEMRRKHLGLPRSAVIPVLSRSRQLTTSIMDEATWEAQKSAGERVWMLCPPKHAASHLKVNAYLKSDAAIVVQNRYKVRNRPDWYCPILPDVADGFLSGMMSSGPWVCLNSKEGLTATNTLYVVRFLEQFTQSAQCAWALMLLTSSVRKQWRQVSRKYALGLCKVEPSDLAALLLPQPKTLENMVDVYRQAVFHLLSDDEEQAIKLADSSSIGY